MNQLKWLFHPIMILLLSIGAVVLSLVLYIYWYTEASAGLDKVIQKANLDADQVLAPQTWLVILILSVLVGIILLGIFIIFVYNQKTFQLYRLQRNFISNFTHELKTPVASLKLYLETFQRYELPREDQLKYIGYMVQDADRLSYNINRILHLGKVESAGYGHEFSTCDIVEAVERFYDKNRYYFKGCDIKIHTPSARSFSCRVNLSLFDILLMNLSTNAFKYNESDTPSLDITFKPKGGYLHLCFEDNGIGLPKREFKKIFKKFYQIGRSDDMTAKGTGLGLYLVDSIARIHKGKVTAKSKGRGTGAVFTLILPIKASESSLN